jgi:nifR3 family TIM-barrel protein
MPYPKTIKIADLVIPSPLIMAPMAGVTCLPYRQINREMGAQFAFAEMLCVNSLIYNNPKSLVIIKKDLVDNPLGVQILCSVPEDIPKALEKLRSVKFTILDVNAACPQRKVVSRGRGAALLKDVNLLKNILHATVKYAWTPVTVKIRLGFSDCDKARDIALCCEDSGVKAIFVHGRTKAQGYRGKVNYAAIAEIKKAVKVPIIASGDIFNGSTTKSMFNETACDGVLVARGAFGNPWVFKEIENSLNNLPVAIISVQDVAAMMRRHFKMYVDFFGEKSAVAQFRKFYIWYTMGFDSTKVLRANAHKGKNLATMNALIDEFSGIQFTLPRRVV